jgi:CheY-like chemotaxis protein
MNNFKILVCDDSETEREDIELFINKAFQAYPDIKLEFTLADFDQMNQELKKDYDLLILDLLDENGGNGINEGTRVLMRNTGLNKIPTVVYTGTGDYLQFDEDAERGKNPSLIKKITKVHNSSENLIQFVKAFVLGNLKNQDHFQLYNEHDVALNLGIRLIGTSNFTYITYQIFEENGQQLITVFPMTSGFSGAILFKLKYGTKTSILKLSADATALRKEHENAMQLYHEFPGHLINHIGPKEYIALENGVIGILIKNVDDAHTFLDLIIDPVSTKDQIEVYLDTLYLEGNSLKDHYAKNVRDKKDWSAIFDQIDDKKMLMVESAIKELSSIITKYYHEIDVDEINRLTLDNKYKHLNIERLTDVVFQKNLVLSHGDFHAKNIMVQNGTRPIIIDTGLLGYKHWSLDISRLIVNIFIVGINHGQLPYYELGSIPADLDMAKLILTRTEIKPDGVNDNVIYALNWLTKNVEGIYGGLYTLFEFQLGLMKEFLQISYRLDAVPPGKRALALMAAHECMIVADINVQVIK